MDQESAANILGISPSATLNEIKAAYRDLVQVWHPDRFGHNPRLREKAQDTLKNINSAYSFLISRDEEKRHSYESTSASGSDKTRRNGRPASDCRSDQSEARTLQKLIEDLQARLIKINTGEVTLAEMRDGLAVLKDEIAKFGSVLSGGILYLLEAKEIAGPRRARGLLDYVRDHVTHCRTCGLSFLTNTKSSVCRECWRTETRGY